MPSERLAGATTVSSLARLYFLLQQNREDSKFRQEGGTIIYVIDNDVLHSFLYPFSPTSARYMRVLEDIHSDDGQVLDPHLQNLLAATSYVATDQIFRGRYAKNILLSPAYNSALVNQASNLAKRAIEGRLKIDPEKLANFVRQVRSSLEQRTQRDQLIELRKHAPDIALSVMFGDDDPSQKLASIIEGLVTYNREYLKEISLARQRTSQVITAVERQLFTRREYLITRGYRTEDNLRDNISHDARALVECVLLNEKFADQKIQFHFLTGDSGIHHFIDGLYRRGVPPKDWPPTNFVRRPLQFSEFMQAETEDGVVLSYLDFVFDSYLGPPEARGNLLFNRIYHWYDEAAESSQGWVGLESSSDKLMSTAAREIGRATVRARESALLIYSRRLFDSAQAGSGLLSAGYIEDVKTVLSDSQVMGFLSQSMAKYKESIAKFSPYLVQEERQSNAALTTAVDWLLEAFGEQSGRSSTSSASRRRMPYFPLFSESLADSINSISLGNGGVRYAEFITKLSEFALYEVHQINIYIAGLLGSWKEAAALADLALAAHQSVPVQAGELHYLKAVALRHIEGATPGQLAEADDSLTLALGTSAAEPRYILERTALALAKIYHAHFYGWPRDDQLSTPAAIWNDLEEAAIRFGAAAGYRNPHVAKRFQSQLYANHLIFVMFAHVFRLFEDPRLEDRSTRVELLKRAVEGLSLAIESRGGPSNVSYYLEFLLNAGRLMVELDLEDITKAAATLRNVIALHNVEENIIPYDRRKIEDFIEWATLRISMRST